MKWVPISPLVDQPQIQKLPNRIQNVGECDAYRSVPIATRAALSVGATSSGGRQSSGAPYGAIPTCAGLSRISHSTSGTSASANAATSPEGQRQPGPLASCAT